MASVGQKKAPPAVAMEKQFVDVLSYANINSAKVVASTLVLGLVIYHGVINLKYGNDSCKWLLSDGRFQGSLWQPYGCMMHTYTQSDIRHCMQYISYWGGRNYLVFMGDARIRQLYYELVTMLNSGYAASAAASGGQLGTAQDANRSRDLSFIEPQINLRVHFLWRPNVDKNMIETLTNWTKAEASNSPSIVITGSTMESIKSYDPAELHGNLRKLLEEVNKLLAISKDSTIVWSLQDPYVDTSNKTVNGLIDSYNEEVMRVLESSKVVIWSSSRLVAQGTNNNASAQPSHWRSSAAAAATSPTSPPAHQIDIQMLLNKYCNDRMFYQDATCCATAEPHTMLQLVAAIVFGSCILLAFCFFTCKRRLHWHRATYRLSGVPASKHAESAAATSAAAADGESAAHSRRARVSQQASKIVTACFDVSLDLVVALTKLGVVLGFVFLCDRTSFFMKENKSFTMLNFFFPLGYVLLVGFFFAEDSKHSDVLHRDQTDEWKGWMQLVILVYNFTGADQVRALYVLVHGLGAAYLFLSGYGHFTYFFNNGDFSVHRLCKVLCRYNLLAICLCFVMNRPYQFYYFVPLISFWYIFLYLTLAIWPRITRKSIEGNTPHILYMVLKLSIVIMVITVLYLSEVLFQKIFLLHPVSALFTDTDDTIDEWSFHWKIDRYSVLFGMVFAYLVQLARKYGIMKEDGDHLLFGKLPSIVVALLTIVVFLAYSLFVSVCSSKTSCTDVQSYAIFIPIVCYAILRNIVPFVRAMYSPFFAWFGRLGLELFIIQYHVWLAADTHGVLVLVPSYPVINVLLTTFVFVCAAHEVHDVTLTLAEHLVPNDWKLMLRNFCLFTGVIVAVAANSGALGFR